MSDFETRTVGLTLAQTKYAQTTDEGQKDTVIADAKD